MRIFNIDITRKGISPVVQVTEHDAMSRFFTLILRNGNADYEPPENPSYSVWYKTKDSTGWYDTIEEPDNGTHPAVVADGNAFTIEIAEQATTSCGELALMINGDDGYQLTVSGIITRSDDIPGYDGEEVENYYNVYITRMQENASRAENAAATAIEYGATIEVDEAAQQLNITHTDNTGDVQTWVTEAEAWAVGKRNGVDVPSTDETYHNNSKYYAGQAANSATASAASAAEAAAQVLASQIVTEASGSIATFADGADDVAVKSLVAEITPVQSGSGDPSPTNVRPISGRTGMTVTRANKNLAPNMAGQDSTTSNGITFTYNDDGSVTIDGTATSSAFSRAVSGISANIYLPKGTYKKPVLQNGNIGLYVQYRKSASNWVNVTGGGTSSQTFVIDEDYPLIIRVGVIIGTTVDNLRFEPYVYPESVSDLTWVSPVKNTYPISWQTEAGTVYGGTLNVTTGVLTVDRAIATVSSTSGISAVGSAGHGFLIARSTGIEPKNTGSNYATGVFSDKFPAAVAASSLASNAIFVDNYGRIRFNTEAQYSSVSAMFSAVGAFSIVYPVETPQTYQLTPTEVKTLLGGNSIFTDAGDVTVEYVADTKLYIDNKIAELQALVLEN